MIAFECGGVQIIGRVQVMIIGYLTKVGLVSWLADGEGYVISAIIKAIIIATV